MIVVKFGDRLKMEPARYDTVRYTRTLAGSSESLSPPSLHTSLIPRQVSQLCNSAQRFRALVGWCGVVVDPRKLQEAVDHSSWQVIFVAVPRCFERSYTIASAHI